ncbi:Adenine specific DNA methylase Mod (type III restriction-modification system) [Methanocella conradii HZ254]|uniref:Adenine specific DNA methylase Mod (Type III restriction-modification system) n=1 Tax=Methanocella conradii (strain DSM 24694 / JCM 17849 / CGMCC 1.5162 / HZ254) TaxID=1041930 RepID=H8I677_METCZ|nr:Adenine specific DNA methylase Mod (type III restriction-modification system) [Methanocella conradii HZ254]
MVYMVGASGSSDKRDIEQYQHKGKERCYNPPVGLVTPETDKDEEKKLYEYDPHLDPQLWWAGKMAHMKFEVPTVSLHVHERIDPLTIIKAVKRKNGDTRQVSLFEYNEENPPLREAIEFYRHRHNWSNRLIAGDSLLVMNSLLEKEGMAGKVQMIYIDPPYGIKYGSNFQPFVNKRDVKDGKDEDLTQEPEMVKAFRDTWELGIHSYLTYLRDRLLLAKELLHESGSIFVQISDENVHHVRELLDEIFGSKNFVGIIVFSKTTGFSGKTLSSIADFLVWYSKDINKIKYHQLYREKQAGDEGATKYRPVSSYKSIPEGLFDKNRLVTLADLTSQGSLSSSNQEFIFNGKSWYPPTGLHWKTTIEGLNRLASAGRIIIEGNSLRYLRFLDDFPVYPISNIWIDVGGIQNRIEGKIYVVQTSTLAIQRCILMTTDPGDLVFDPTCGSGTTAYVAEQWGRRWITCDTSRVAITLAKQRLMTALFDYYELAYPEQGVGSGFRYKTVPHITLKSIANDEPPTQEILYDQPYIDRSKVRVTGPFTVEAVPAPTVKPLTEIEDTQQADESVTRSGETLRQAEWRDELFKTGIRGKGGQKIEFSRVEPLPGAKWLHADAETKENSPQRVVISFGPEHMPLEQKQVELAIEEAQKLIPKPKIVVFAAFHFDPEAAKDIDETRWPGVTLLKVQMNTDLLTEDLKKKRASNESFMLIGQPDVELESLGNGKYKVSVHGFDYYNTKTGVIESGGKEKIAMWMLDTDYDGRSLYPRQVFFPMAGEKEGWAKLAKNLKAEIDEELIEAYRGTESLPFTPGPNKRIAVKIVDDRGIESLKIMSVE